MTFENAGSSAYSSYNEAGYTFKDVGNDTVLIYGPSEGYGSKVLHHNNWSGTVAVTQSGEG